MLLGCLLASFKVRTSLNDTLQTTQYLHQGGTPPICSFTQFSTTQLAPGSIVLCFVPALVPTHISFETVPQRCSAPPTHSVPDTYAIPTGARYVHHPSPSFVSQIRPDCSLVAYRLSLASWGLSLWARCFGLAACFLLVSRWSVVCGLWSVGGPSVSLSASQSHLSLLIFHSAFAVSLQKSSPDPGPSQLLFSDLGQTSPIPTYLVHSKYLSGRSPYFSLPSPPFYSSFVTMSTSDPPVQGFLEQIGTLLFTAASWMRFPAIVSTVSRTGSLVIHSS